jgi:uncharacterized protein YjdB
MMPKHSLRAPWARLLTALAAVSLLTVSACSSDSGGGIGGSNVVKVEIVTLPNLQALSNLIPATTRQFLGVPTNSSDNWVDKPVTWATSNAAVVTISVDGLATAVAGGTAYIRATSGGKTDSIAFAVRFPVGSITLAPATITLAREGAQQITATTIDTQLATVTGRTVTWVSSNPSVATVSATGLVQASAVTADGTTTTITATAANALDAGTVITATRLVTVTGDPVVNNVLLTGTTGFRGNLGTLQLTAVARSGLNNVIPSGVITWSTSNASVATVDGTGLITFAGGTDTLTITAAAVGQGSGGSSPESVAAYRIVTQLVNGDSVNVPTISAGGFIDYTASGNLGPFNVRTFSGGAIGTNGDSDMYVFLPGAVGVVANNAGGVSGAPNGFICRPWNVGSNEVCDIASVVNGWYRIRFFAYNEFGEPAVSGMRVRLIQP